MITQRYDWSTIYIERYALYMKIGIISDTHDRLPAIDAALSYFSNQNIDTVLHCGDWKSIDTMRYFAEAAATLSISVHGILGNNDVAIDDFMKYAQQASGSFTLAPLTLDLTLHGRRIMIHHGHHKPTMRKIFDDTTLDIIAFGHTHKPKIEYINSKLVVNPGSTAFSIPRSKAWAASVAVIDLGDLTAKIHYLA